MTKANIKRLLKHINFRVSNLGFYEPQIHKKKDKVYNKYYWVFTIKQEVPNFDGYKIFFFESMPYSQFQLMFNKTKNVFEDGTDAKGETPSTSTMLYAYATICDLLNTLLW